MSIQELKDGDGIGVVILINGEPTMFNLALFGRRSSFTKKMVLQYGFVNMDKALYIDGIYSGGNTGLGRDQRDMRRIINKEGSEGVQVVEDYSRDDLELVTTDPDTIKQYVHRQVLEDLDERAADLQERKDKTDRINAMPKAFQSTLCLPVDLIYERSDAEFDPRVSHSVRWCLEVKLNGKSFSPLNYQTGGGQVQVKKFAKEMEWLFGKDTQHLVRPEIIRDIIEEYKNVRKKIEQA